MDAAFEVKNEWCLHGDTPCETVIAAFHYFRIFYSVVEAFGVKNEWLDSTVTHSHCLLVELTLVIKLLAFHKEIESLSLSIISEFFETLVSWLARLVAGTVVLGGRSGTGVEEHQPRSSW